ncbi:MAG TPA: hypothetical protein VLT60_08325 [Usitatibacter sp.]|nr:hypothetical protein [Usitatibacter sp.]
MDFETRYPQYADVAEYVRRANAERSVYIAHLIATGVERVAQGFRALVDAVLEAERDWHHLESESFARHAAKRY